MPNKQKLPDTITWKAPSHNRDPRSLLWYLIFGLVALALIGYAIYNQSLLMGIMFCVIIFSIILFSGQSARTITYKVTKTGITSGNSVYGYKTIKKFWILYNPPAIKTLNLETTAYLNNIVSMELGRQDPVELKLYLSQYLPEDLDREESLSDVLARQLKI